MKLIQLPDGQWISPDLIAGIQAHSNRSYKQTAGITTGYTETNFVSYREKGKADRIHLKDFESHDEAKKFRDELASLVNQHLQARPVIPQPKPGTRGAS